MNDAPGRKYSALQDIEANLNTVSPQEGIALLPAAPARELTPEEVAATAMLPFAALAALLSVAALCLFRLRAEQALRKRQMERERREEEDRQTALRAQREQEERYQREQLLSSLRHACYMFRSACGESLYSSNRYRAFEFATVTEAMKRIPHLVWERRLLPEHANLLEAHASELTIANGLLVTLQEELERSAYLDSARPSNLEFWTSIET